MRTSFLSALAWKKSILLGAAALAIAFVAGGSLSAQPTEGLNGCWKTIDDETGKVRSTVCIWIHNNTLYGAIRALHNRAADEEANPMCSKCGGSYHNKPIIGMTIIWGMKKGSDVWEGGTILDPKTGKTYRCVLWKEGGKLKVRGKLGPFYRTQTWVR